MITESDEMIVKIAPLVSAEAVAQAAQEAAATEVAKVEGAEEAAATSETKTEEVPIAKAKE